MQSMVKIDKGFSRPDLRSKFFAGHQFARSIQQSRQYLYGLALQAQLNASLSQFSGPNVELKTVKPQNPRSWSRSQHTNFSNQAIKATTFGRLQLPSKCR
jgi:hypothetical protein